MKVHAGPLEALLVGAELRYVRAGGSELVRRLVVAVRDDKWGTVVPETEVLDIEAADESFSVEFRSRYLATGLDLSLEGHLWGSPSGTVSLGFSGTAQAASRYNRAGCCVLLPGHLAGARFQGRGEANEQVAGELPRRIGPQHLVDGNLQALHAPVRRLDVDLGTGARLEMSFEGDLFETEDQRNWGDASFKIYSTPLALGWPHLLAAGGELSQLVTCAARLQPATNRARNRKRHHRADNPTVLRIGEPSGSVVPAVGIGTNGVETTTREVHVLRALAVAHLRCEVAASDPDWAGKLHGAQQLAHQLDCGLELALSCGESDESFLCVVASELEQARPTRVLLSQEGAAKESPGETTPMKLLELAHRRLDGTASIAAGSVLNFCELNRRRPSADLADGLFWPINPQVHASDDLSLLETPEAFGEQVRTARWFAPGSKLHVSPLLIGPRGTVDARQCSTLGAAWLTAALKYLSDSGLDTVSVFEPGAGASPLGPFMGKVAAEGDAAAGTSVAFQVLAEVSELSGAPVLRCESSDALRVIGLAVERLEGLSVLVANLSPSAGTVTLENVTGGGSLRRLRTESSGIRSLWLEPVRQAREDLALGSSRSLELDGYETVRIDVGAER